MERAKIFGRNASNLKVLQAMKKCMEKDLEDQKKLSTGKTGPHHRVNWFGIMTGVGHD